MMHQLPGLYFAPSGLGGRGVFCAHDIEEGDTIEVSPVIVLPSYEKHLIERSILYEYYFAWGEDLTQLAISLGYGSLYNHSDSANAEFILCPYDDTIVFEALEPILANEEITIDYRAGERLTPLWFEH